MKHHPSFNSLSPEVLDDVALLYRNVMVPMRDGIELATDIYLPVASDQVPIILERTPYDKSGTPRTEYSLSEPESLSRQEMAVRIVRRGYGVVWQDCRGRFKSGGKFTKYLSEGDDGHDTCKWITAQPWCDGKIGTMGLSYGAHTQMALACTNAPGLACMILDSGGFSNAYTCGIRQGGAFEMKQATWCYNQAPGTSEALANPEIARAIKAEDLHDWFKHMPWTKGRSPLRWLPEFEEYLLEQWQHGTFDAFWQKTGIYAAGHYATFPKVPMALMSSWYDAYVQTTLENYEGLAGDPDRPLTLIMGPWTHGNKSQRVFGDVDFGAAATFDGQVAESWFDWRMAFFDRWLKGIGSGLQSPVSIFVMGGGTGQKTPESHLDHGGHWVRLKEWPGSDAQNLELHLCPDMTLRATPSDTLSKLTYDFDPANPVPTIGGSLTSGEPIFSGGGYDQVQQKEFYGCDQPGLPLNARLDVLSFETAPLEEDVTVAGPVTITLKVSTNAPDTDFTAKLIDVYPPSEDYPRGYALGLTDGIFRVRYRNGFDKPELVGDQTPFDISITPFATANLFCKGHRIRLDISSSNFPKYDVNSNTGEPEGTARTKRVAQNSLHLGGLNGCAIRLQLLNEDG